MANNNKGWDVFKNRTSHYLKFVPPGKVVFYFLDGKPYYKIGNTITQMGGGGSGDGGGDDGENAFRIDVKQTGNTIVAAGVNGTAPYEYKLDNGSWFASGIFANITEGEHTVYVREKNNPTKVVSQKFNVTNGDLSLGKPVLQARAIGKSTLLTWTYSGRVPSVFQIYRATKGGPRELVASVGGTERTWQDGTSSPRTEYTYDIVPIDAQSSGIGSDPVTIVTGSDDLATPRLNGVVSGDDVKLTISVDTARMKSILLKRKKEPAGAFELLKEIDATGNLTYQDNDLSAGIYTYTAQGVGFNASELGQVSVGLTLEVKTQNPVSPVIRAVVFGNSITSHGNLPDIGWNIGEGNAWGMAATQANKDYVSLVRAKMLAQNSASTLEIGNSFDFERQYFQSNYNYSGFQQQIYNKDLLIMRIGENVDDSAVSANNLYARYSQLIDVARAATPGIRIVLSTAFWNRPNYDAVVRQLKANKSTSQSPIVVSDFADFADQMQYKAYTDWPNASEGVKEHPGNAGMAKIADRVFESIQTVFGITGGGTVQIPPDFTVTQVADGRLRVKITGRTDSRRYIASVSIGDYYTGGKAIYGNYNLYSQNGEFDIVHSTAGLVSNTVLYVYVADYAYQGKANEAVYLFTYYGPDTGNPGGGGVGDFSIPTDVRTDDPGMLYLTTTKARYGIYITWGGTIARINHINEINDSNFLSDPTNLVNCADLGREVQWAIYGWPLDEGEFKPGGQTAHPAWKTIGWDPIQAGDMCAPSKVEQWKMWPDGKKLYVRTRPMHWGYCNSRADCFVDTFYVVNGMALEVYNFLTNQRGDYFRNLPRGQDWGGGFIRGDYTNNITYFGNKPGTGLPVTEYALNAPPMDQVEAANDGAFQFYCSEGWSALKSPQEGNERLFGVWSPTTIFSNSIVGQFNKKELPSQGSCVTLGTHIFLEKMDRNIKYAWNVAYVVGNVNDIRGYALGRRSEMFKPDWNFAVDRQRWWTQGAYENGQESSYPFNGYWEVKYDYEWSNFCSPEFAINMNDYDTIELFLTTTGTSSTNAAFNIHKKTDNGKRFNGAFTDCVYNFPTVNDGQMRRYEVNLTSNPAWGNGTGLRMYLDFGGNKELGRLVRLHKIRLYKK